MFEKKKSEDGGLLSRRNLSHLSLSCAKKMSREHSYKLMSSCCSISVGSPGMSGMFSNYVLLDHIGSGCLGSVYRVKHLDEEDNDNQSLVVKVVSVGEENNLNLARSEIELLERLKG